MATYSPSLKITLLADGEQSGVWGQTQNTNLGTLLEQAITGVVSIDMADANYTLTDLNGTSDEARNAVVIATGTNNAIRDIIAPQQKKLYTVYNNTTGGYGVRIRAASGDAVTIPNGITALVYCDGVNFYSGLNGVPGNFYAAGIYASGTLTAGSNVVATTSFNGPGTGLTGTAASLSVGAAATLATTNFSIVQSGSNLLFKYGTTSIAKLSSTGEFTAISTITGAGSI